MGRGTMKRAVAVLALLLVFPGVASGKLPRQATRYHQFGGVFAQEARKVFGSAPACTVRHVRVPAPSLPPSTDAQAFVDTCTIEYSGEWWDQATPRQRCVLMVHEYGHLLGLGHSDDPENVMYAEPRVWSACRNVNMVAAWYRKWDDPAPALEVWALTTFQTETGDSARVRTGILRRGSRWLAP